MRKDMYKLYEDYKSSLKLARKGLRKRQKINANIRDKYEEPFGRQDYNINKNDITSWNRIVNELKEVMKKIEMYLKFEDRELLHKDYEKTKRLILNPGSYEGLIPLDDAYGEIMPDSTDIVCDVEMQEEIVELLDRVLAERQREVVEMYFWEGMTQEQISDKLGISRPAITKMLANSLENLRNIMEKSDFTSF